MFNTGLGGFVSEETVAAIAARAHRARGTILTATSVAKSGHPGGSFSSAEILAVLYSLARIRPNEPTWADRDRIVISHGHVSPAAYALLGEAGFFPSREVAAHFRQLGSPFEGHVERTVPGIEWSTGNLGQGLSAGVGFALGARLTGGTWHTYVAMSDGEQHKGQVAEARRLAVHQQLDNLTVVIAVNGIQISGSTADVMPVPLRSDWEADGWHVIECDGHDVDELVHALGEAHVAPTPTVILAHTVIGKGVSFMEGDAAYHGKSLTDDEYGAAMAELGLDPDALESARELRLSVCTVAPTVTRASVPPLAAAPRSYAAGSKLDNRSAWGDALVDLASANPDAVLAVLDCDLAASVKTEEFAHLHPQSFIECGVGEHNAATAGGALSTVPGVTAFWADFGVFGIDEVYNQQRLNAVNHAHLKLVLTHCGADVGEDGKTHQCLDYIGAFREMFGWRVLVPADANQTDRAVKWMASEPGCIALAVGRSALPVLADAAGNPLFAGGYEFRPGEIKWARTGSDACLLVTGTPSSAALAAADLLTTEGVELAVGIVSTPLEIESAGIDAIGRYEYVISVEDHHAATGLGATVALALSECRGSAVLHRIGVREFLGSGSGLDVTARAGLDAAGIGQVVREVLRRS